MSGPKGYGYAVIAEQERLRREDEARAARCQKYVLTLASLTSQLRDYEDVALEGVLEPSSKTRGALASWEHALEGAIESAESVLRDEVFKSISHRLEASRRVVDSSDMTLGARASVTRESSSTANPNPSLGRVSNEVEKLVLTLAGLDDVGARDEITQLAERVLRTSNPAQAKGDLLTLKTRAASLFHAQAYRKLAEASVLDIAHVESPEADALRARATRVTTPRDVAGVRRSVAEVLETFSRAMDAEFVEAALEDALSELGFTIGEGFELEDLGRSVAIAKHPDHPGYGVRVQLNPANGMIYTRLVSERASSPEDDARAEDQSCKKIHALAPQMGNHGVAVELKLERKPGEATVDQLGVGKPHARRKRSRTRASGQSRTAR